VIATDEHEPGAERAESRGRFKPDAAGGSRDDAGFAPHAFISLLRSVSASLDGRVLRSTATLARMPDRSCERAAVKMAGRG
jgi:hypothetical protein